VLGAGGGVSNQIWRQTSLGIRKLRATEKRGTACCQPRQAQSPPLL